MHPDPDDDVVCQLSVPPTLHEITCYQQEYVPDWVSIMVFLLICAASTLGVSAEIAKRTKG